MCGFASVCKSALYCVGLYLSEPTCTCTSLSCAVILRLACYTRVGDQASGEGVLKNSGMEIGTAQLTMQSLTQNLQLGLIKTQSNSGFSATGPKK